jgi:hypothetical protein
METEVIQEPNVDVVLPVQDAEDPLAKFREQVAAEKAEPRNTMSESALAKLRAIREQDRLDDIAAARFKTALSQIVVTPENIRTLVERCNTRVRLPAETLDRMATKLGYWLAAGFELGREIDSVAVINFLAGLTPDEVRMSPERFAREWDSKYAAKVKQSRLNRGVIASGEPAVRPCKAGKQCLRFEKRKPAPAKGSGEYCSPACAASDKARQKRDLVALPSDSTIH